jgi:hypothetical protein
VAHSILEDLSEQTFTESTIKRMYALVDRAKTDADFQKLIYGIVNAAMPGQWKNYKGELTAIFNWFKKTVDYRRDPYGVELLQDVWSTLDRKRGDCDDATTFLAAAAEVLGSPARIVTVSTRPSKEPNHVYAEALVGGRWQGLDATVPQSYVGWAPPQVTDRKIWTRKELGLSGGDDFDGIEGLGMSDNGYGSDGFRTDMRPVSQLLAPGVPDDISKTYAAPMPGVTDTTGRKIWRAPVANNSDWTSNPRPGGGVYGPALPIAKRPLPQDLWYLVDRKYVPKILNPDSAWWGKVPTSKEDLARMFPGAEANMENYLKDIASVPASAIAEVTEDVKKQLASGEIGVADVPDAITEGLEGYALGRMPRMKLQPGQRPARKAKNLKNGIKSIPPVRDRRYLVPAPGTTLVPMRMSGGHMNGLGNLGDSIDDAAKLLSSQISSGQVPATPSAINSAINSVVSVITGQPTNVTPAAVAQTAIPVGMLAALGLTAWLMTKGGSPKYKRNPSRRRSRGGRGGGFDVKKALMWGGGGLAAYMLLRPGGILMPAALAPKPTTPIPGLTASQQAAVAAGVKAAPGIFDSIAKLFGGGSSTPAPAPTSSGMVTSYSQLTPQAPAPAPSSGFVTDYSQLTPQAPAQDTSDTSGMITSIA